MIRLAEERLRRNWSQAYVALKCDVDQVTVSRWERGISLPIEENRRCLCELFGMSAHELGIDGEPHRPQSLNFARFAHDPIVRLPDLPHTSVPFFDLSSLVRKLSEEAMISQSRRAFLKGTLSSMILLPLSNRSSSYEALLHQCTVGLAATQEMYRSKDADDLRLAYDVLCGYSEILETIAQNTSRLRAQVIDLLAGAAILKMLLGWHCIGDTAAIMLAKDALSLGEEAYKVSGDPSLWLSAHSKLAWAYSCKDEVEDALKVATEAEQLLLLQDPAIISNCIRGGTYSTLAIMRARNQLKTDMALGKANEVDPGEEVIAFMNFTRADQIRERAITYYHAGNQAAVRETLIPIIDPETLDLHMQQSERERVEAIKTLADSSIATKERNMEQIITYWLEIVQSAHMRQSESGLVDARRTFECMKIAFPGERDILALRDYLVHWQTA